MLIVRIAGKTAWALVSVTSIVLGVDHLDAGQLLGLAVDHILIADDIVYVGLAPAVGIRPELPLQAELGVLGGHLAAVVELDALAQRDGVDLAFAADLGQIGGQVGEQLAIFVVGVKIVVQHQAGAPPVLAALGAGRVEAADVAAAKDPVDVAARCCRGCGGGGGCRGRRRGGRLLSGGRGRRGGRLLSGGGAAGAAVGCSAAGGAAPHAARTNAPPNATVPRRKARRDSGGRGSRSPDHADRANFRSRSCGAVPSRSSFWSKRASITTATYQNAL